jgi:hypothetical protein
MLTAIYRWLTCWLDDMLIAVMSFDDDMDHPCCFDGNHHGAPEQTGEYQI